MRLVLLHGFTQTAECWRPVRDALGKGGGERIEVAAPDLPGHGGAPGVPETMDLPGAAAHLAAGCGRAIYAGYSMGGRVALQLALDHPAAVERLVLVSTTAGIEDLDERLARKRADDALADRIEDGGDGDLESFLTEWLSGPLFRSLGEEQANVAARLGNTSSGLAGALRALGTGSQLPNWERLSSIEVPVLVVTGALDEKFSMIGLRLQQAIGPNATLVVVPGAGHALAFEQPVAFARMLSSFAAGTLRLDRRSG